ncbi:MAG: hypothetical protein HWE12_00750 [Oceanospirillaceae bacterium]|nr:hypothetical protein [Oceanospirillaceae bacterium]
MNDYKDNALKLVDYLFEAEPPLYTASTPLLAYRTSSLGNYFGDIELELMPKVLKASKGKAYEQHLHLLRLVLLNLVAVGFKHEQLTLQSTPRAGNYLKDKFGFDQRRVARITDALTNAGLMEKVFYGSLNLKLAAAYRPTKQLMQLYADFLYSYEGDFDDYAPIRVKRAGETVSEPFEGNIDWYSDTEADRAIIIAYNEFMRKFTWARKDATHRSFGSEPFTASRVHTPYQTIVNRRVPIRKQTLLDGEPLAEPDFSANHLTMLSMLFDEPLLNDPYEAIANTTRLKRNHIKMILVRLLGATGEQSYNQAKHMLVTKNKEFTISHKEVDEVRAAFYKHIPMLKENNLLCTGWGNKLQYLEGQIAMRMLKWALNTQTPIINVHDAYSCKKKDEVKVHRAMLGFREEVLTEAHRQGWLS